MINNWKQCYLFKSVICLTALISLSTPSFGAAQDCDKICLKTIADQYRAAYVKHDPSLVPIADNVLFSENFVMMPFPDATWDTVTKEVGPALTLTDPVTGQIGIYTAIMEMDTPGFLAIRLKVDNKKITEIEHIISTKRNLSSPPTPIGDVNDKSVYDPIIFEVIPPNERISRKELIAFADGYFATLERNNGEIRGTRFSPEATRRENGMLFAEIEAGFKSGRYFFNDRVRREHLLVDEELGIVMSRGFIDHKGDLDTYKLTDGTIAKSIFREPQSWGLLEMFKIKDKQIVAVVATFIQSPYNMGSPWDDSLDPQHNKPRIFSE